MSHMILQRCTTVARHLPTTRTVRIIAGGTFTAHTEPLYQEFSILKLDELYKLFLGIYMYKQENQLCPKPLKRDVPLNGL